MINKISEAQKARWSLIEHAFNKICNIPSYSNFRSNTFCVLAHLGLQLKAKEEKLFETDDWDNPECKDELLKRVKTFLIKYIK